MPLRLCWCGRPTPNRPAVCDECKAKKPERKREVNRYYDTRLRDPRADAFYHSTPWKKRRAAYLASVGYLCEECMAEVRRGERKEEDIELATDVHHKVALADDWSLRLEWNNLQALCDGHHKGKRERKPRRGGG